MNIYQYAFGWPWLAAVFNVLFIARVVLALLTACIKALQ